MIEVGDVVFVGDHYYTGDTLYVVTKMSSIHPNVPSELYRIANTTFKRLSDKAIQNHDGSWKSITFTIYKKQVEPQISKSDPNYKYIHVVNKIKQMEEKFKNRVTKVKPYKPNLSMENFYVSYDTAPTGGTVTVDDPF